MSVLSPSGVGRDHSGLPRRVTASGDKSWSTSAAVRMPSSTTVARMVRPVSSGPRRHRGGALVAQRRQQRRHAGRGRLHLRAAARLVHGRCPPRSAAAGCRRPRSAAGCDSSRQSAMSGRKGLRSRRPAGRGRGDGLVVGHDHHGRLAHRLRDHRIDLARHDAATRPAAAAAGSRRCRPPARRTAGAGRRRS